MENKNVQPNVQPNVQLNVQPNVKKNNKNNNTKKNTNVKKNNTNKTCPNIPEFILSDERDKTKNELLQKLIEINENLSADETTTTAISLALTLYRIIIEEQSELKNRQKIITNCLKYYNDILKNYDNKSIRINKFEKIAQTLGLNKKNQSGQIVYKA